MKTYTVERNLANVVTTYGKELSYSEALALKLALLVKQGIHAYVRRTA